MKWMFNIITVINVFIFVVIISYTLSAEISEITVLRLALYPIILFGFKKYLWPLYRQVVDRWQLFLAASLAVLLNFMYAIITASDIQVMLNEDIISLLLMVLTMFCIYATIFWSLSRTIKEYEYRSEKQQLKLNENLLYAQLNSYEEFVESSKRNRHDLRHHNEIIMEYLQDRDVEGAEEYLKLYDSSINESTAKQYCENHIANTVLCLYDGKTQAEGIYFTANANIPKSLTITLPELGSMLSNILENALEACKNADCEERTIALTADAEDENLKIEVRNTVSGEVKFKNDLPVSTKECGGIGIRSVIQIVSKYGGMINFRQNRDVFLTQIILPV
jgi:sensor histidine kinase regulating citrate/malate metabolism